MTRALRLTRRDAGVAGAAAASLAVLLVVPSAAEARPADHDRPTIRELDVTNTPDLREGQPVVAVNPKNPNNLVYTTTVFPPNPELEPVGKCFLAYSRDRGHTWTRVAYPMGDRPKCGEPQVVADAKGTFYLLNNQVSSGLAENMANHVVVSRSSDGGRTWTGPVTTPLKMSGAPKLRVDLATGKVYADGGSEWEYPSGVSVSADGGRTWGEPHQIPGPTDTCLAYPGIPPVCGFPGRSIAVYDGILASPSQGENGTVAFYVSRDDGRNWTTRPVTDSHGRPVPNGTGPLLPVAGVGLPSDPTPWVAADATRVGRFAVMVPRGSNLEIYTTNNAGKNWTGPAVIAVPDAQRPAIDFGPTGALGVMWRTTALDAYSTVSFDHGRTFGPPLRVNHTTEPIGENGQPGDRASYIALTNRYAYVAWSDGRSGPLDGILAVVPLDLYLRH